jgi:hypothetical protein
MKDGLLDSMIAQGDAFGTAASWRSPATMGRALQWAVGALLFLLREERLRRDRI